MFPSATFFFSKVCLKIWYLEALIWVLVPTRTKVLKWSQSPNFACKPKFHLYNLFHFFFEIWFVDTQNTFYLIVKGLKNAFFIPFFVDVVANDHPKGPASCKWSYGGACLLQIISSGAGLFLCEIRFRTHIFIIWGQTHNQKKIMKSWPLDGGAGGGSTPSVSLTVKYLFISPLYMSMYAFYITRRPIKP